ncbi:MAG: GNAT family N-acetyltransferase [Flavobacteriia bacterium]|nr:GNAT family N-acetyltransferase [Flavobacteriia bacterium]
MSFLANNCTFQPLTESLVKKSTPFVCDDDDLCEFFAKDFIPYNQDLFGKTYCFTLDEKPDIIVCAFTISNDSIKAQLLPKPERNKLARKVANQKRNLKSFPAVLIGRLGVNKDFEGKGIGKELMEFIKAWFIDSENKTGCRFLVVDSYNKERPIKYYSNNGFNFIFRSEEEEKEYSGIVSVDQLYTRLMFFDLIILSKE